LQLWPYKDSKYLNSKSIVQKIRINWYPLAFVSNAKAGFLLPLMPWEHLTRPTTRGRCYDHNFLRFFPIFCEKLAFFSKTNVMINFFSYNLTLLWVKNANFFAIFFRRKYFKNHNIGPWFVFLCCAKSIKQDQRPVANLALRGKLWPPEWKLSPR
jgi:hypothetical protein